MKSRSPKQSNTLNKQRTLTDRSTPKSIAQNNKNPIKNKSTRKLKRTIEDLESQQNNQE